MTPSSMQPLIRSILITSLAFASSAASASMNWFVCKTDLSMSSIRSPRIDSGVLSYIDTMGFDQDLPLDQVFFLLPAQEAPSFAYQFDGSGTLATLTLTDQQYFPVLIQDTDNPDKLKFITPFDSQARSVFLESIDHLRVGYTPPESLVLAQDDLIRLNSNDTLSGFIESIGSIVVIDTEDRTRSFPLDQINLIQLTSDPDLIPGIYVYLDSDIRMAVGDLVSSESDFGSGSMLYLEQTATDIPPEFGPVRIEFEPEQFGGIDIKHRFLDMVSLASLTPSSITPTGDRSWTPDPESLTTTLPNSGLGDLDLQAPVEIRYALDQQATRFACDAELIAGQWSDCTLEIRAITGQSQEILIQSIRLNTDNSRSKINIDLPESTSELVIRVEPGANGPIQDRVILRKPRLLIEQSLPQFE